jgi:hypothetical protein
LCCRGHVVLALIAALDMFDDPVASAVAKTTAPPRNKERQGTDSG